MNDKKLSITVRNKIQSIKDQTKIITRKHESFLFNISLIFLFGLTAIYCYMTAFMVVPDEISLKKDAFKYYSVALSWLNGEIWVFVNYDIGISIIEATVIFLGSFFFLDSIQSLIILFSIAGLINVCLVITLVRNLTNKKWAYQLVMSLIIINKPLIYNSVRPLTDTFHAILILLIIIIEIKLFKSFDFKTKKNSTNNKIRFLLLGLSSCLGIIVMIRHASLIFLLLTMIFFGVYICSRRTTSGDRIVMFVFMTFPGILISFFYLVIRCSILGDIKYLLYFGATSNLWVDSYEEGWYYFENNLPNPTFFEYLEDHSLLYIIQREFLGFLHIFTNIIFFYFVPFFLALGFLTLLRKDYRTGLIICIPVVYIAGVYGWFWDVVMSPIRFLIPIEYICYLLTINAVIYLINRSQDLYIQLSALFISILWLYPGIYEFLITSLRLFLHLLSDFPFFTSVVALLLFSGMFLATFYSDKILKKKTRLSG